MKHSIQAGGDPHTVVQWSGHRTMSMPLCYHIISLDDLRRAGNKASDYRGPRENVVRAAFSGTRTGRTKSVEAKPLHAGFPRPPASRF